MTAEQYLDRVKKIDLMIHNKQTELDRWESKANSLGGSNFGERVQSSRDLHKGQNAIDNCIDLDREIEALKQERKAIIETIEQLPSTEYDVIYKLYVQEYSMKEIAYHHGKSYDWMKQQKKNGLVRLQSMIDERRG